MSNTLQKIALVTGANSGIGKEIAIGLAKTGARVIMVCRHFGRGQKALEEIKSISGSTSIDLLIADLSSQTAIRLLVKTIYERYTKLDLLINNAGLILTKKKFSAEQIEMTLATNYLGPFLLTNSLLNLLKESAPSRIINISSAIHTWAQLDLNDLQYQKRKYQFLRVYAQSKLLMNLFTFELAQRIKEYGITVNCVHPGAVKTNLGSENAQNIALYIIDKMIKLFFTTPKQAAKPILDLALSPKFKNVTGSYFVNGKIVLASQLSYESALAKEVWERTDNLIAMIIETKTND